MQQNQLVVHPTQSKIPQVTVDPKLLKTIQEKIKRKTDSCPSTWFTTEELQTIGLLCFQNPNLYRQILGQLSSQRNPNCLQKAEEKFKYVNDLCSRIKNPSSLQQPLQITHVHSMYWNLTKTLFDLFYKENVTNRCVFQEYPLNKDRYNQYQEILQQYIDKYNNQDPSISKFLTYYKGLRYISYSEFENRLIKSAEALVKHIRKIRKIKETVVILRLAYMVNKSALWVVMLIYHIIQKEIDGVECFKKINPKPYQDLRNKKVQHMLLIYPDDCIYSGNQFKITTDDDYTKLKEFSQFIECYSLCPFVSTYFTRHNTSIKNLHYLNLGHCVEIETIKDVLPQPEIIRVQHKSDISEFAKKVAPMINIYFQHKLADNVSIPLEIFVYGRVPEPNRFLGSLIDNCPYLPGTFEIDDDDFFRESQRCPPSCYKKIVYTWKNKPISPNDYLNAAFGIRDNQTQTQLIQKLYNMIQFSL
jgi:hypothetical protein